MLDTELLGKKIRELRSSQGLTQSEFAQRLNVSCQAVSNWERGISPPDLDNLIRIASQFGVLIDDLLRPQKEELFLGVDGGGTKTEFAVVSPDGRVLKRIVKSGSNPNDIGFPKSAALICDGIAEALVAFPGVKGIFCGIAGITTGDHAKNLSAEIKKRFPQLTVQIGTDALNLLAMEDGADMAVISGTGSVVFVRKGDEVLRLGGWGYLFDQAGSAYDMGRSAIAAALEEEDFLLPPSLLTQLLRKRMQVFKVWDHIHALYAGGKPYVASFSTTVFEAYEQGDRRAIRIVDETAQALARLLNAGVSLHGARPVAVASGGIFEHHGDVVLSHLKKYSSVTLLQTGLPPIYGACRKACKPQAGKCSEDFYNNFSNTYGGLKQ
ncbi:MAG: XRE family transcriptional regulator [Clostridia bacterium]|nr:XRE family transcriptional regulator [Clostridia bacterium]